MSTTTPSPFSLYLQKNPDQTEKCWPHWTKYIPENPTGKQLAFLMLPHREAFFGGSAGGGKLLGINTPIATQSGWKPLSKVHPGEMIFGSDGKLYKVLAESKIQKEKGWLLTFDDGSTLVAHDEHLWLTYNANQLSQLTRLDPEWRKRRRARRASRVSGNKSQKFTTSLIARNKSRTYSYQTVPVGTVRTTSEIVKTLIHCGRSNHAIPVAKALQLPELKLLLDPYLLGAWLGDGTTTAGSITSADPQIFREFQKDFQVGSTWGKKGGNKAVTRSFLGLRTVLKQVKVFGDKHIPDSYLWSSGSQRLALLQGLMDTDGFCCKEDGSVEFTSTKQILADGVAHLAKSLGWKANSREGKAILNGEVIGPKWRVTFSPDKPVFRLKRKLKRQKFERNRRTKFRFIISAKRVPSQEMKCLRVNSPNHLFLAGRSLIPTHNSSALLMGALQFVDIPGYSAIIFRKTFADLALPGALIDRSHLWLDPWAAEGECKWDTQNHKWIFPSGATLQFGFLGEMNAHQKYQGAEFCFVGFDEVAQHFEDDYLYMFSRLRRLVCPIHKLDEEGKPIFDPSCPDCQIRSSVPLRMRCTSNPPRAGDAGRIWLKQRFKIQKVPITDKNLKTGEETHREIYSGTHPKRAYVPSFVQDNPYVDQSSYIESLTELDPVTRDQLLKGDWGVSADGRFRKIWMNNKLYHILPDARNPSYVILHPERKAASIPIGHCRLFQTVDPAASTREGPGDSQRWKYKWPSWTVISTFLLTPSYDLLWLDMVRFQKEIPDIFPELQNAYKKHKPEFMGIESNGLNIGVYQMAQRMGLPVKPLNPRADDKLVRSTQAAVRMEAGKIWFPIDNPPWLSDVENELFTWTGHKDETADIIDTLSYAAIYVSQCAAGSEQVSNVFPSVVPYASH